MPLESNDCLQGVCSTPNLCTETRFLLAARRTWALLTQHIILAALQSRALLSLVITDLRTVLLAVRLCIRVHMRGRGRRRAWCRCGNACQLQSLYM